MQEAEIEENPLDSRGWRKWFKGHDFAKRFVLFLLLLISLTFFINNREVLIDLPEVGSLAPRYISAQIAFDFPDLEATRMLKQEAVRDIGSFYRIDENQIRSYRKELELSLIQNPNWRSKLSKSTFENLYTVLDRLEEILIQAHFTDQRTLNKMHGLDIPTKGISVFSLAKENIEEKQLLPERFWQKLQERLKEIGHLNSEAIDFILAQFSKQFWLFQEDLSLERSIKHSIQDRVVPRYTHIEPGSQIIKVGERVSQRHLTMLKSMKHALAESRDLWAFKTLLSSFLIALSLLISVIAFLNIFYHDVLQSVRKLALLVLIFIMTLIFSSLVEHLLLSEENHLIEVARIPILVPFASILICILFETQLALIVSLFLLFLFSAVLAVNYVPFILINFIAVLTTVLFTHNLHKRKQIFSIFGKVWLSILLPILGLNLAKHALWGFNLISDVMSCFVFLCAIAILTVALLPILESLFHVTTDMSLMEYMDPNHELLHRLSLEAPGTYQHCLVVGHLAEAGARSIGANGLFCRVATLYHDIGKLFNPHYFTENQFGGFNIHQLLTPMESTQVIIAHVPEGEALARKHHLPQGFIDIIREHHGTTMVYYFYCKQMEQMGSDANKVNEKLFRYPGPKPRSRESAIIMIADTIEAASRSMEELTEESITDMIDKLIDEKAEDGQFNEAQLTFEELGKVKKAIIKSLIVTRHLRIKYPSRIKT
ncbi:MAG: HDIG domain-containing metalloprotein [Candidatus Rhabdochlamydia sp.]